MVLAKDEWVLYIGAGLLGLLSDLFLIASLSSTDTTATATLLFLLFTLVLLSLGYNGYQGWKQRNSETRDHPFVIFELDQVTTVDVDSYFGTAEVDTEKREMEIPVPDKSTMKTVTSNVR